MRMILASLALLATMALLMSGAQAGGEKQVTLKGEVTCAKCGLSIAKACATVIVTKEGGKDQIYYFEKDSHKKYHGDTCTEAKKGTVVGTVAEKDGKKVVTVSKVTYE